MFGLQEIINSRESFWKQKGPRNDIVLSTRVRLGRNAGFVPFTDMMDESDFEVIKNLAARFLSGTEEGGRTSCFNLNSLDLHQKRLLLEKNIITGEMENSGRSLLLINNSDDFTILVNDGDHFRIQLIRPGFQLLEAYRAADAVDDALNSVVSYAFSERYGYLAADPVNVGTGMKVSVILHLPVLTALKRIGDPIQFVRESGFQMTGTLGNTGRVTGGLYLVASRKYLGLSEVDVLETADDIISRIIKLEDDARDEFISISRSELEDSAWRSLGILLHARRVNYVEAVEHLSRIRLGVVMSVIRDFPLVTVNDLMVKVQWAHLQEYFGIRFKSIIDSDDYRAMFLRTELRNSGDINV